MSAEQLPQAAPPDHWTSETTGITYPTERYHWWQNEIAICPACGERPCDPDCPEQILPKPARRPAAVP